jgi:HEAT repeat protein
VHLSSFVFPMSFGGLPLLWLGGATDAESIARIALLDRRTNNDELREELAGLVAAHTDAQAAVPVLEAWAQDGGRPNDVRAEAVEGLQHFSSPHVLSVLAGIARNDRDGRVRADAVEAIGELSEPAALDTLRVFVRTLRDERLQAEAVEAIAELTDTRVVSALREVIEDRTLSSRLRSEALESLAERSEAAGG